MPIQKEVRMPRNSLRGWLGWGFVLMRRNITERMGEYALYLMLVIALIMCSYFIIISSSLSQRILAGSVLVTIIVGGFINMFNIFRTSKKFDGFLKLKEDEIAKMDKQIAQKDTELAKKDVEIETLKEANKLNEIEIGVLKEANKLAEERLDIEKAQKKREDTAIPF
jgi:multisubunit Na+/H+ antiporter MnhF subunit